MAAEPVSGPDDLHALRAERDALARRAAAAEERVSQLDAELAGAREQLHQRETEETSGLSLFEGGEDGASPIAGDGSDPRALPVILGATAIVAAMVTLLAFLNGNLFSWFGLVMLAITGALAYAAAATRVQPVSVRITRGIVHVEQGDTKYRFDLSHENTRVEQHGRPGDSDWRITFARRHTGPFSVDATMVDAAAFLDQVREYRPSVGG